MSTSSPSSPAGNIGGEDGSPLTTSAIVAQAVSGSHVVNIDGYSRTKGLGNGKYIASETFAIGGHRWRMRYYPDGEGSADADWISIYLHCNDRTDANKVKAELKISLLDQDRQPVPSYSFPRSQIIRTFSSEEPTWGFDQFIKRKDLEESIYLRDDAFSIRCDVTVSKDIFTEQVPPSVVVPPSDMHQHLGNMLLDGDAADVTFNVGAETFAAHRCVLAARSSVFKVELLGAMKEKTATLVRIDDMEPMVFRALLHFIYTDSLPAADEGSGAAAMAQHLLVAADRYNLERLKLICEGRLCDHVCRGSVATTLALAEQHGCVALKKACFRFLTSPGNLKAVVASDGFEHLRSSCPSILEELVAKLAP
ncbi:BTB/POZ and MATH domain-containing protein 1-like [Lolium rigidum]|uniref:BTB/POZ and MATH domain-containing protein 1-like n=1 Tax=Lolium rigidum TaxID=89674 RepID=UPI001F5DBE28|nr:BTB/POZ and MATH domain-containing protein 1-like [Lolium rigidum]